MGCGMDTIQTSGVALTEFNARTVNFNLKPHQFLVLYATAVKVAYLDLFGLTFQCHTDIVPTSSVLQLGSAHDRPYAGRGKSMCRLQNDKVSWPATSFHVSMLC